MKAYYAEYLSDALMESLVAGMREVEGVALLPLDGAGGAAEAGSFEVSGRGEGWPTADACLKGRLVRRPQDGAGGRVAL